MTRIRATNSWSVILVAIVAVVVAVIGARHVWVAQHTLLLKRSAFIELTRNRDLAEEHDVLERQVADLMSAPRMALRARELLGMRPPRPDELIVVHANGGHPDGQERK